MKSIWSCDASDAFASGKLAPFPTGSSQENQAPQGFQISDVERLTKAHAGAAMGGRKRSGGSAGLVDGRDDVHGTSGTEVPVSGGGGGANDRAVRLPEASADRATPSGSMPPPPSVPQDCARGSTRHSPMILSRPAYATLRRMSRDVPSTSTLPDEIPLPAPGDVDPLTLGRNRTNGVTLDCPRVPSLLSRHHAEIFIDAHGIHHVTDKNTLNGTYLNGSLIPSGPCPLQHGDILAFGGPANVLRENRTLRNSFRFQYHRPMNLDQWREAITRFESAQSAVTSAGDDAPLAKRARVQRVGEAPSSSQPDASLSTRSTLPATTPTSRVMPPSQSPCSSPDDAAEARVDGPDPAAGVGLPPEGYRSKGAAVTKLTRRDVISIRRVASKMETRPTAFLSDALREVGGALAEVVVPLDPRDETVLMEIVSARSDSDETFLSLREAIAIHASSSQGSAGDVEMTQATQEYVCPSPNKSSDAFSSVTLFLRQTCREALELHLSPSGVVSYGLKLFNASNIWDSELFTATEKAARPPQFRRGDLVAEAVALALWPLPQLGWAEMDSGDRDEMEKVKRDSFRLFESHEFFDSVVDLSSTQLQERVDSFGRVLDAELARDQDYEYRHQLRNQISVIKDFIPLKVRAEMGGSAHGSSPADEESVFASSVSEIDGYGCDISSIGCVAIAEGVLAPRRMSDGRWVFNECLRGLYLGKNPRIGDDGCAAIAKALTPRRCLNGSRTRHLTMMFNTALTSLDLSGCGIGPKGARALVDALTMIHGDNGDPCFPSSLRTLKLSGNRLDAAGCRAVASLLGPRLNERTSKPIFNPSLSVLDISDNPGMDDSVAEAFVNALKPRENNLGEESQRKDDEKPPSHLVNSALLELHLCGNAFDSGVVKIQEVLDPLRNGSSGATASTVNVVFARNTTDSSFSRSVLDAAGDDHELVFPVTIGCAAERRQLSYWHWRPWNTPELSANRVDPRAEAKATASVEEESFVWQQKLTEDYHATGASMPWSMGYSLRSILLHRVEGGDSILPEDRGVSPSAGLPQWLEDELRCVICTDIFVNPYAVNGCGHVFCHDCVSHWLTTQSNQCPICRHRLTCPISLALTPCKMAQGLLDHYVLPYLPPKDAEARRERAREVRDKAEKRALVEQANRERHASANGGAMGSVSGATAALARILAAESGVNTIRVTSTAGNLVMLHQLLEAGQTAARRRLATSAGARVAPSGATPPTDGESGSLPRAAGSEGLAASLRSAQDVLRTLAESRRRREEQLASLHATAEQLGILIPLEVQRLEGGAASRSTENQAAAPHERVTWTALSSAVDVETPCQHCRTVIPPRFLRMRRFATVGRAGASTHYYHPNMDCLRSWHHEIRAAPTIEGLSELSDQERRVVIALCEELTGQLSAARARER